MKNKLTTITKNLKTTATRPKIPKAPKAKSQHHYYVAPTTMRGFFNYTI